MIQDSKKKIEIHIWIVALFIIILKPIVDMFYAVRALDAVLLCASIALIGFSAIGQGIRIGKQDIIPGLWLLCLAGSLCITRSNTDWIVLIKILSVFPVYYMGKLVKQSQFVGQIRWAQRCYGIVLFSNILVLVLGFGYQVWAQGAKTFSGVYYFKTDLALAMAQVLLFMLSSEKISWKQFTLCVLAGILILLSNSRIYFAIALLIVGVCGVWSYWKGTKLSFRSIALFSLSILLISVILLVVLAQIPFFKNRNFISFTTQGSIKDMMVYNLMYRNIIWADMLNYYKGQGLIHIIFGNGCSDWMPWYDAHSLYVTTIYKFGIVGVLLLVSIIIWAWRIIRDNTSGKMYFLTIGLWIIFLVAGISYTTAESTQYTWWIAFIMGMISNNENNMVC